jgi:hypothetical protein
VQNCKRIEPNTLTVVENEGRGEVAAQETSNSSEGGYSAVSTFAESGLTFSASYNSRKTHDTLNNVYCLSRNINSIWEVIYPVIKLYVNFIFLADKSII